MAQIRRLSTASWLKASPGDVYATFWTWYWTNDQNQWVPFDGGEASRMSPELNCDSSNEKLEENFLSGMRHNTLVITINKLNIVQTLHLNLNFFFKVFATRLNCVL